MTTGGAGGWVGRTQHDGWFGEVAVGYEGLGAVGNQVIDGRAHGKTALRVLPMCSLEGIKGSADSS